MTRREIEDLLRILDCYGSGTLENRAAVAIRELQMRVEGTLLISDPNYPRPTGPAHTTTVDASGWPSFP